MSLKRLGLAVIAFLAMVIAAAAPAPRPVSRYPLAVPGRAPLMVFGGRSAAQMRSGVGAKLDAALADLARHATSARPGHALEDLHSLNPAARFKVSDAGAGAMVAVDAVTRGDPQQLEAALVRLGLEHPAVFRNDVGGWLPVSAIESAAALAELHSLRAALSRTRGVVATQGDYAQGTATLRGQYSLLDGTGVTVGILSDSYDCYAVYAADQGKSFTVSGVTYPDPPVRGPTGYAFFGFTADAETDVSTGALPANVKVLAEAGGGGTGCITTFGYPLLLPYADEGRAMLQIVHAVAPGASLAFYTADNSEADFAHGIQALASAGAKVVADDVGYFDEPFFEVGLVGEAIDTVYGQGVAYFSAAGNDANLAYDNTTPKFDAGSGPQAGESLLNFDATDATKVSSLMINVPAFSPGEFAALVVQWDQPYVTGSPGSPGATSLIDMCVSGAAGFTVISLETPNEPVSQNQATVCTGANAARSDPVQVLILGNPANAAGGANSAAGQISVSIGLANATAPGRIKVAWETDGAITSFANFTPTTNATIQGHPNDPNAATVGAAFFPDTPLCGVTPAVLESYSSFGGSPILFASGSSPIPNVNPPQKPDFVGPDGTNTTFFGFPIAGTSFVDNSAVAQCANNANLPNYFGTSAATPHAAALAALMVQSNASLTPTQIYAAIRSGAAPMVNAAPDFTTGYGFIQAGAALAALPAGTVISVSPSTITVGQSATVTWNGIEATSCTGSGSLSTSATSGTQSVSPASMGTQTYTLSCTNAHGSSMSSAVLTVNAAPPSGGGGHGGGALGELTLLVLAGLLLARLFLYSPSLSTSANTKPSRSTTSPTRTAMGAENIGPADTAV